MYDRLLICMIIVVSAVVYQVDAAMTMEQIGKTAAAVRNQCITKSSADAALVAGMQKGEFPDNELLKCYTLCIMKTMRTFKNGNIDPDMMIRQIDLMMPVDMAGPIKEVTLTCSKAPPTGNDCETTFQYVKCSYETDPAHFFFP